MRKTILTGLTMATIFTSLSAGDLEEAIKAYKNENYVKSNILFKKSCNSRNAMACTMLGELYSAGGEHTGAFSFFKSGCDLGNAESCHNVGYSYSIGQGIKQDKQEAKVFYKKACEGGFANSCNNLGILYESESRAKAKEYYRKGCDLGDTSACSRLATLVAL